MPTRNRVKIYGSDQYYHVYNGGVNKEPIFREDSDYSYFLSLFKRYLSEGSPKDNYRHTLHNHSDGVELVAYCLMPNHYHLLVYLKKPDGLSQLMRSVMTAYTMYFNKKYKRVGGLYQGIFLASPIASDQYLWHVSRYIHLNPLVNYSKYAHSSIAYYTSSKKATWLHTERLVTNPKERLEYAKFVSDYKSLHKELEELKHYLAAP